MESSTYQFAGREWRQIQVSTFRRRGYLLKQLKASGIDMQLGPNETPEEFGPRIIQGLIESGVTPELIGGLVLPVEIPDAKWSPEIASETAAIVGNLTDEDHPALDKILIDLSLDFFVSGLRYRRTFLTVSTPEEETQPEKNELSDVNLVSSISENSAT
jgi:hypothetical protein